MFSSFQCIRLWHSWLNLFLNILFSLPLLQMWVISYFSCQKAYCHCIETQMISGYWSCILQFFWIYLLAWVAYLLILWTNLHIGFFSPLYRDYFFLTFQFGCLLFIFSYLIALTRTSSTMLNSHNKSRHPAPDLMGWLSVFHHWVWC